MANSKERKKDLDNEIKLENKNMKRGKPQQPIYRPGGGLLKKSSLGIVETESDTKLVINSRQNKGKNGGCDRLDKLKSADSSPRDINATLEVTAVKLGDIAIDKRKAKKPEQSFYVARPVAQAREAAANDEAQPKSKYGKDTAEIHVQVNGTDNYNSSNQERLHNSNRSKRYSNRRYQNDNQDIQEDWRSQSVRNVRQGSEPRAISNQNTNYSNRMRDTRSVEPAAAQNRNYSSEKVINRPPSGRRHSTIGVEPDKRLKNLDNLPPRLKKKYLEDNNLTGNYNRNEEQWDGSSITFQGSQNYGHKHNYSNYSTLPSNIHHNAQNQHQHGHQDSIMFHTLPSSRPRGRGRVHHDYDSIGMYRSATPEKLYASPSNSRPHTPPIYYNRTSSSENLHRQDGSSYYNYRNDSKYNEGRRSVDQFNNDRRTRDKYSNERDRNRYNKHNENRFKDNKYNIYDDRNGNQNCASSKSGVSEMVGNGDQLENPKTPRVFSQSLEAQLSPVSPPTPPEKETRLTVPVNNTILDWSEEVELNDKLEAEALSDALTRSSSIASLMEASTKSLPPTTNVKKTKKKRNRKNSQRRSESRNRDKSSDSTISRQQIKNLSRDERGKFCDQHQRVRQSSVTNTDSRDNFKVPEPGRRKNSRSRRDGSYDTSSRGASRDSSFDRRRKNSCSEHENWREEARRRQNSEKEKDVQCRESENKEVKKGGILVLPSSTSTNNNNINNNNAKVLERPKCPDISRKTQILGQKTLFDPNNPNKPIIVKSPNSRVSIPGFADNMETPPPQLYTTDQFGNVRPAWYDENSERIKQSHYPDLLREIIIADTELQYHINSGMILINWGNVSVYRNFLMESMEYLLCKDMKFCQSENVEHHFWKILFYNIIEMMRKAIASDPANKEQYKGFVLYLIDEGVKYFEMLLDRLEEVYNFKIANFLGYNTAQTKGKFVGLALISAQKIFLYLGDLLRYKEQVNETSNYGKCRQWYVKAHEVNPKNGKPYNQLALLAVYARRKLDAVYYYMRSLMSSNPAPSARESLNSLFDENRKKYEQGERKRREERIERARQHMKEKESQTALNHPNSLRREIWIRPDGGRRVHRTTSAVSENQHMDSEEEDLATLSSVEVNKRFVTSYLHVHGKLITKIGMESFQETAIQMLKEFRALLQHSPVPLPCKRFLQLLALNMFAIESTQLKDPQLQSQSGYRSELQERALVVSLQMFSLILERCVSVLQEHIKSKKGLSTFPQDLLVLLPAVKTWCDWMLCHSGVWNPPPSTQDYKVGAPGDAWTRIAALMNLLEKLDQSASQYFVSQPQEGFEQIRLPEDAVLSEFTPLMHNVQEPTYVSKEFDMEMAQFTLRLNKLLFFGTVFLCGLEPPVLKLELENDYNEYVSVVRTSSSRSSPPSPPELNNDDDLLVESFSEDEEEPEESKLVDNAPSEIRDLLNRKVELEKRQRHQELHRQRVQKILQQSVVSVHIEVRPKYLIPDTNCFIDYLNMIKSIASAHVYTLMVPLVVLNELEGLAKGGKSPAPVSRTTPNPEHIVMVAESAKHALDFVGVKNPSIKCITTKGTILASSTFTVEDDSIVDSAQKNDDKILASCLAFCKPNKDQNGEGEPRKLCREVVLLTEDRNLRVKALVRDVPVRELPDFIQWAGLG